MKNLTWQQWTALGVCAAAVITEVVLCFVQPFAAIWGAAGFIAGGVTGYLLKKNNVVNDGE